MKFGIDDKPYNVTQFRVENEIIGLLKELSYEPKVQLDHISKNIIGIPQLFH